ncbi:sacsin N-terminal ATP-binding-like domain-containing protein, partial [Gemmatimonadota bacterium]
MYSDSTHFVYEILQNADDHGASEVQFRLDEAGITIEHDGQPFTKENVDAITYFGKSTSRDDLVKAGRFGVGFKSVFTFTATPIIISGDEHFRIYGLYRVTEHPYPAGLPKTRTRIILPFNHEVERPDFVEEIIPADEAFRKIEARLVDLNMTTLLFTQNIREIRWEVSERTGHYLREDNKEGIARLTTITDGEELRKYLVFARTPTWRNEDHKAVEIAFGLDEKGEVMSLEEPLFVLFSTTQETDLQFMLNGPFRTNPSRENISHDDRFNLFLLRETAELLKSALPGLRDSGYLTPQFLGVLPNSGDDLKEFYRTVREAALEAFREEPLVPTDTGGFSPANLTFQGPA